MKNLDTFGDGHVPRVHKERTKKIDGQVWYYAEVSDNAGTHGVWKREMTTEEKITTDVDEALQVLKEMLMEKYNLTLEETWEMFDNAISNLCCYYKKEECNAQFKTKGRKKK